MAFLETHVFSQALEVAVTVNVLLPEPSQGIGLEGAKAQEPPRVMYLLHGYSDDQSIWMRRTSVERYCAKYNLAVIMPAVNHSYYANELQGERYWDYVSQELPQMMHSMFRLSQAPGTELVAGLSMGGYVVQEYAWQFGGCAGYLVAGATPILLDCYSGWERAGLRASTPLLGVWPWRGLKSAMAMACSSTEEGRAAVRRMFDQLTRREFLRGWRGIAQCLHPEKHFSFDAPLLVCRGERDRTGTIARHMEDWKRAWPEPETAVLPGAAHVVNLDAPEAFNRLLLDFLTRCGGSRRRRR